MSLPRLIGQGGSRPLLRGMIAAALSSAAGVAVLATLAAAIASAAAIGPPGVRIVQAAGFAAAVLVHYLAERRMIAEVAGGIEVAVHRVRTRLFEQVAALEMPALATFSRAALYDGITQGCRTISSTSHFVALTIRSGVLAAAILSYVAYLSPGAATVLGAILAAGGGLYLRSGRVADAAQHALATPRLALFEQVEDLVDGFKEQKLNSLRARALRDAFGEASATLAEARVAADRAAERQAVLGETVFNLMLGAVVFVVPQVAPAVTGDLVRIAAAVLLLGAPVLGLVNGLRIVKAADAAARGMIDLGHRLAEAGGPAPADAGGCDGSGFAEIRLEGAVYAHPAEDGTAFAVGPVDLSIRWGEIVFLTGGNGAGKSTLVNMLLGLLPLRTGRLCVDGVPVGGGERYRALMAAVFADFHLFAAPYGLDLRDGAEAADLLAWLGLDAATISPDRLDRAALSAGQKRRAALAIALLERRPLLILDELAADQDPQFRARFYGEILPALRDRGATILAITHDERFLHVADRVLVLEAGRLTEAHPSASPGTDTA